MIIGIDIDDVVLDLMPTWLKFYCRDFSDCLTKNMITNWDITKFIKPEAKEKIYEYIENKEVFLESKPINSALQCIDYLKSLGHRIIYITANNPLEAKRHWLKQYGFLQDDNDFVQASDKGLILADVLLDDNHTNCSRFKGIAYLLSAPWNEEFVDYPHRVNSWDEFMKEILQ
jgi:5'(3')-deoxyribonucleotidase